MPVKKTRKPAAAVKYLLSGDRKLQRLSLKKIADRATKPKPRTRSARVKQPANGDAAAPTSPKLIGGRLAVGGAVCLFAAAALLAARQPAVPDPASGSPAVDAAASSQAPVPAVNRDSNTTGTAATPRSSTSHIARPQAASPAIETSPGSAPVKKQTARSVASSTAPPASIAPVKNLPPLTVEGCLESDGSTYRLKDTSGLEAPKARSWRTGFLMKRSSTVALVDTTGRLKLGDHVGRRVAATGSLADRELRATALRQVAASCR